MNTHDQLQAAAEAADAISEIANELRQKFGLQINGQVLCLLAIVDNIRARHFPTRSQDEAVLRERFEAWAKEAPRDFDLSKQGERAAWPGQYNDYRVECAWQAYLSASRPAWMPIASAPKDGTRIIGWLKGCSPYQYYWNLTEKAWLQDHSTGHPWQPTHWQPLPAQPTA